MSFKYPLRFKLKAAPYNKPECVGTVVEFVSLQEGTVVVGSKVYDVGTHACDWISHTDTECWEPVVTEPVDVPVRTKKFVNAIIPVHSAEHVQAVLNEAERLGYEPDSTCSTLDNLDEFSLIQCIHLGSNGKVFAFIYCSVQEIINCKHERYTSVVVVKKLRKLRELDLKLNQSSTESVDNQAVLEVEVLEAKKALSTFSVNVDQERTVEVSAKPNLLTRAVRWSVLAITTAVHSVKSFFKGGK